MKARILFLLGLLLAAVTATAGPGQVLVVFKIGSSKFTNGLKAAVEPTQAKVATKIAAQLQAMFPPIEWTTTAPTDGSAAVLTATLVQDDNGPPGIGLKWSGQVGDRALTFHDLLQPWPIYEVGNPVRPYRNPDQLIADIDAKLNLWMGSDETEKKMHNDFVMQVPLATHVDLDMDRKAVVIPLSWAKAKLADNSEFRLEFTRAAPLSKMTVLLDHVAEVLSGTRQGNTQSLVASCADSGAPVPSDVWEKCIAMLGGQGAPPLEVAFQNYEFFDRVSGVAANGSAVRP
jgi:hypothetical protein